MKGHCFWLVLASLIIAISVLLDTSSQTVEVFGYTLPPLCSFKVLTGWNCPGCGLTRSFAFMGELSIVEAFRMHNFGPVMWIAVAAQIPYRLVRMRLGARVA